MLTVVRDGACGHEKMDVGVPIIAIACAVQRPLDGDAVSASHVIGVCLGYRDLLREGQQVRHGSDDLARDHGIPA